MNFSEAYLESAKSEFSKTKMLGLKAIQALSEKELNQDINESNSINRQIFHYAYHVGQIVLLSKQFKGPQWESLSIPRGKSGEYSLGSYAKP